MAILSAILSLVVRQLSHILQAIFGWSITALFGKLPAKKQAALTVALVLSIAWPVLVLGAFLPTVAAWTLAFLPLHKWMSDLALRLVWIALALVVPLAVGAITRWITPSGKLHGGVVKTLLGGFPLTIGYATAFVVTAVTVPIVKILSVAKGWDDVHVYVQAKEGKYFNVLAELVAACEEADIAVKREPVPAPMALASKVIQRLARPFLEPILADDPQRLRGASLEAYLYPADLLLRGEAHRVAHVRSAITRTMLERYAYLVAEPEAQDLQDQAQDLWDVLGKHRPGETGAAATSRLRELSHDLDRAPISFEAWTALETIVRRLERAMAGGPNLLDPSAAPDTSPVVELARRQAPETSTPELVRAALSEARELAKLEVALAKDDAVTEARAVMHGAVYLATGVGIEILALSTLAAVMVSALAHALVIPIVIGAALAAAATAAVILALRRIPRRALPSTRARLAHDLEEVRDHVK